MQCPDEHDVAAIAGGETSLGTRALFQDHIDDCGSCRQLLAGLIRSTDERSWRPGERVGRYILGERIGRGGMGTVYRAEDVELGRAVALKRLHLGAGARDRLIREARSAAQLQHPNVVAVYEVVDDELAPFLAMELVDGVTLGAWLRVRPRRWHEVVAIVAQAGRGLAAAHARGLVHRDFKPDNILVDRDGRARVADFGLANVPVEATARLDCRIARVTATGAGTPAYMAPELVDGGPPGVASDVYALAVTLFEGLHGRHPFGGATVGAVWTEMALGRIRGGGGRVPAWLERRVRRGLAPDPADRWPDVASFVAAVERRPRWLAIGAAAGAAIAVAAVIATLALRSAPSDDCERGAELVDTVWNPSARLAITAQFGRAAPQRAAPAVATASEIVDHWRGGWQLARRAACTVEQRPAHIACLDRQLDELRAQLAVWTRADAEAVDRAVAAAGRLPAPSECGTAVAAPPTALPIAARIAQAKVLWRSGRATDAAPLLPAIVRDAEVIGHRGTLAEALLTAAIIEQELNEVDTAADHAARAAAEASKAGDDYLLFAALIQQAYSRIDAGRPADALGLCDAAEALSARGLPHPEKVAIARGGALMRLGRTLESVAQYERAIAMMEPAARLDPVVRVQLAIAIAGLGNALLLSRRPDQALAQQRRALALQEVDYGPDHPEVARTLNDLAQAAGMLHRFDEAEPLARRARAILLAAYGADHPEVGQADVMLASFAARQGRIDDARRLLDQARAELARSLRPDHQIFEVIEAQLGSIEQDADRAEAAIPHYEKAAAILLANHTGGDELARLYVNLGACLLDRGRSAEAKAKAERALEELEAAGVPDAERAMPWMILAMVADERHDRARAIELARKVVAVTTDDDSGQKAAARKLMQDKLRAWTR